MFLNHFNVLMLKIIFKNKNKIILMYFQVKSTLKSKHNHYFKLARSELFLYVMMMIAHPPYDGDSNFMELANL
jgi:hypothetical protein